MSARPHLSALVGALILLSALILAGHAFADSLITRYVHALAPVHFPQKNLGSALANRAIQSSDLLPVYGSSEFEIRDPYEPNRVFRLYPTGFTVFYTGGLGVESLIYAQRVAGNASALRGKKVIISLYAGSFYELEYRADYYAGNFSRLHAYALAFNPDLSMSLRERAARRMLDYPSSLDSDLFLQFSLERLADGSPLHVLFYDLAWPLGQLQLSILGLQDEWETVNYIREHPEITPDAVRREAPIKWDTLLRNATSTYVGRATNNPYGFDDARWNEYIARWGEPPKIFTDEEFMRQVGRSAAWNDLDILLQELHELGARPLIISIPLPGRYYETLGVSQQAHRALYQRLEEAAANYHFPMVDLADYDNEPYFFLDANSHLSSIGWVTYSRVLDAFYHDSPLDTPPDSKP